jgi:predicted HicB family RNase H-like nuclease
MMQYKGFSGQVSFDEDQDLFHGEVVGIRDVITFQGRSVDELRKAFEESVDDYLDFCRERGESPEKPFSGKFALRLSPELHRRLAMMAAGSGQSLNAWIASRLENEAGQFDMPNRKASSARASARSLKKRKTIA